MNDERPAAPDATPDEPAAPAGARRWSKKGLARLVVLTTIVSVPIWSGWLARRMMFPGCPTALPAKARPFWKQQGVSIVDYATADGIPLRGILARGQRDAGLGADPRPTVVFFHGNAESAADNLDTALMFSNLGLDTFVAEYRGYGGRPGSPSEEGLLADGRAALAAVERELGVPREQVILVGRSLGTGVAAAMASEGAGRAVVLLSPYTSMIDMARTLVPGFVARLAVHDRFDSAARLAQATQPVLVVHGTADPVIPVAQGKALAASLGARAKLLLLEGVGHNDLLLPKSQARILEAVMAFLRAHRR